MHCYFTAISFFSAEEGQTHHDSFSAIIECKKEKIAEHQHDQYFKP
jgi:hypothetical protein